MTSDDLGPGPKPVGAERVGAERVGAERPAVESMIKASGAWTADEPAADRNFVELVENRNFALEGGGQLSEVTLAYETWGQLNAAGTNAVLVCHALTGDAHAAGSSGPGQATSGWWDEMIGPGRPLDSNRYFIVCANVLGGCQGTTGPASINPANNKPYGARFPLVTIRDIVRTQAMLANRLGIECWLSVIGGSMGGMQALEWAVMFPERVASVVSVASAAEASPMQIGWSEVGRLAIANDPKWNNGDYYNAALGEGPTAGLMLARRIAQIHYRSDQSFHDRFGRATVDQLDRFGMWDRFQIESYLDHHGAKLARRFDANSYMVLNRTMDLHDIGRGRGGLAAAAARVQSPALVVSINSDGLYVPRQQQQLRDLLVDAGVSVAYEQIESVHGHDGFLIEFATLGPMVEEFLATVEKNAVGNTAVGNTAVGNTATTRSS